MQATIEKIIDAGNHAPSGDNCQPWRFEVKDNQILLYLLPDRDSSLYSWGQRASLIANGAAIENMVVAAENFGYATNVEILPNFKDPLLIAIINFKEGQKKSDKLYGAIFKRTTNRKPYKKISLEDNVLNGLKNSSGRVDNVEVKIVTGEQDKKTLGYVAALNEKILFSNYQMHKFFYDHINWNASQELKNCIGFYVKTLEIPAPAMPGFKLAKNWSIMKNLNRFFNFSGFIAKQNEKIYSSASALGAVIIKTQSEKDYISAGRIFERLWLTVTSQNLSLQPLTGIYLLMQRILAHEDKDLTAKQIEIISDGYNKAFRTLNLDNQTIALTFRIGEGGQPSARTLRLPPNIKWTN